MRVPFSFIYLVISSVLMSFAVKAQDNFKLIKYQTTDGGQIEAALFQAKKEKVVVFAHGAVFNKESWYFLAEQLQASDVTALPIDFRGYGKSKAGSSNDKALDIIGAVAYLEEQGYKEINIIGGSMGGAAVLRALPELGPRVSRVVLMAPAGGPLISSKQINKLFIVSKGEGMYNGVLSIYRDSAEPKRIREFAGRAHAQHMFKEAYAQELTELIISFIRED